MQHLREFFSSSSFWGMAIGFAWKGLFEAMDVSETRFFFFKSKMSAPRHCSYIVHYRLQKLLCHSVFDCKDSSNFLVTETIDIIHLLWSLSVRSASRPSEWLKIWILEFLVDSAGRSCFNYCPYLQSHTIFRQYGLSSCVQKQKEKKNQYH